ncbi:hypothetical protein PIB19_20310 [Sphingomonas sp. 7/4-4]|uniref:hypothetical protein n=1 Tax=Sphingomonas sp. 7/4-4 TaxID=3018446 RepID=UPI0022F3C76D|nr:hypothetical protein [Sphingomonas sp. 7/4-4]WBY07624.1 hypothetical protein PIB19_20310 [Sphingomonas sp. 7/4-4]
MREIEDWTATAEALASKVEQIDDMILATVEPARREALARAGFPALLPLWRSDVLIFGLVAWPGRPVTEWTGVVVSEGQALTLAATARHLLPMFILTHIILDDAELVGRLKQGWPALRGPLEALHRHLGGEDLTALEWALGQEALLDLVAARSRDPAAYEEAASRLARRFNPTAEFIAFADWLDAVIRGEDDPPVRSEPLGPWRRLAIALAYQHFWRASPPPAGSASIRRDLIESFSGIDSGAPRMKSWGLWTRIGSGESTLLSLAGTLSGSGGPKDEIDTGLARAIEAGGMDYDGVAHAEATAVLAEGSDPIRGWGTLNTAAWWMARQFGEMPPAIADGVKLLTTEQNWPDLRWVVEHNLGHQL